MQLVEIHNGYVELHDDGTWTLIPVKFTQAGNDIIKTTFNPETGSVVRKEFHEPRATVTVDADGNIRQIQRGFVLDHELHEPVHPDPALRYVRVPDAHVPADLFEQVPPAEEGEEPTFLVRYRIVDDRFVRLEESRIAAAGRTPAR